MDRREALASLLALPTVARVSRLEVRPNETIVLECPGGLSFDQAKDIQARLQRLFPDQKVLVLTEGMQIRVLEVL